MYAQHVRTHEEARVQNAIVHMRLGGEIDESVHIGEMRKGTNVSVRVLDEALIPSLQVRGVGGVRFGVHEPAAVPSR